jgi:hypothetical protein
MRDNWAFLPQPFARALLDVLYAVFERRPPFETVERTAFDIALDQARLSTGLSREQFRRGVFEEINYLPWSEGLEPWKGGSWLRRVEAATGITRVVEIPREPYRLTRRVARRIVEGMRDDGLITSEVDVELPSEFALLLRRKEGFELSTSIWTDYGLMPLLQGSLRVAPLGHIGCKVRPQHIFLAPNLGQIRSDEEAEDTIRQMWLYAVLLHGAIIEALSTAAASGHSETPA